MKDTAGIVILTRRALRYVDASGGAVELPTRWAGYVPPDVAKRMLETGFAEQVGGALGWYSVQRQFLWDDERTGWRRNYTEGRPALLPTDVGYAFEDAGCVTPIDRQVTDEELRQFYATGGPGTLDEIVDLGASEPEPVAKFYLRTAGALALAFRGRVA